MKGVIRESWHRILTVGYESLLILLKQIGVFGLIFVLCSFFVQGGVATYHVVANIFFWVSLILISLFVLMGILLGYLDRKEGLSQTEIDYFVAKLKKSKLFPVGIRRLTSTIEFRKCVFKFVIVPQCVKVIGWYIIAAYSVNGEVALVWSVLGWFIVFVGPFMAHKLFAVSEV